MYSLLESVWICRCFESIEVSSPLLS